MRLFLAETLLSAQIVVATATGSPTDIPTPPPGGYSEPWEVSPGVAGFLAFFVVGLALVVIARLMTRSVRRIDHTSGHRSSAPVPKGGIARPGEPLHDQIAESYGDTPPAAPDRTD